MYMWPKTDGGRASEDVASCLLRYIKEGKCGFRDTCGGQNGNFNGTSFWTNFTHCELVECVDHNTCTVDILFCLIIKTTTTMV